MKKSRLKPFNRNDDDKARKLTRFFVQDEWDEAAVAMNIRSSLSTIDVEFRPTKTAPQPAQQAQPQASAKAKLEKRFKALLFKSDKPDKPRKLKDPLHKEPKKKKTAKRKRADKTQVPVLAHGKSDKPPTKRRRS